jgi:hypothetical protein
MQVEYTKPKGSDNNKRDNMRQRWQAISSYSVTHRICAVPSASVKVAFKSLKINLGKCYAQNPPGRSINNSKASGILIMYCPSVWPLRLVIFNSPKTCEGRGFI